MRLLLTLALSLVPLASPAQEIVPEDGPEMQVALSTAFSYQGQLVDGGVPVDANVDLRFTLWDADIFGSTVGSQVTVSNVAVTDGLFTAELDFGAAAFTGDARWMQIEVRNPHDPGDTQPYVSLVPRTEIMAVPYAIHALNGGGGGGGSGYWELSGSRITNVGSNQVLINRAYTVGAEWFGVHAPTTGYGGMYITTDGNDAKPFYGYKAGQSVTAWTYHDGSTLEWRVNNGGDHMAVRRTGELDMGTTVTLDDNDDTDLGGSIALRKNDGTLGATLKGSTGAGTQGGTLALYNDTSPSATVVLDGEYGGAAGGALLLRNSAGQTSIEMGADFNPGERGIVKMYAPTGTQTVTIDTSEGGTVDQGATLKLHDSEGNVTIEMDADYGAGGEGRVTAEVIEITGGADFSEQFDLSCAPNAVEPGSVVSIDPASPGELCLSAVPYDRRVAGIVSGAGGVKPGMLMGQRGTAADGRHPVALSGRVYCKVDASYGSIEPGDLLTTSPTTGYAMKVTDHERAAGTIIGKAMGSLDSGRGLVLVLVSLQ